MTHVLVINDATCSTSGLTRNDCQCNYCRSKRKEPDNTNPFIHPGVILPLGLNTLGNPWDNENDDDDFDDEDDEDEISYNIDDDDEPLLPPSFNTSPQTEWPMDDILAEDVRKSEEARLRIAAQLGRNPYPDLTSNSDDEPLIPPVIDWEAEFNRRYEEPCEDCDDDDGDDSPLPLPRL